MIKITVKTAQLGFIFFRKLLKSLRKVFFSKNTHCFCHICEVFLSMQRVLCDKYYRSVAFFIKNNVSG